MNNANRVVFNTGVQYVRIIVVAVLGLFSTRYIFRALGDESFGLYDLLAGVIGLLGFVTASLVQTSNRFISFSLGDDNIENQSQVFNDCWWTHLFFAFSSFFHFFYFKQHLSFIMYEQYTFCLSKSNICNRLQFLQLFGN